MSITVIGPGVCTQMYCVCKKQTDFFSKQTAPVLANTPVTNLNLSMLQFPFILAAPTTVDKLSMKTFTRSSR